MNSHELTATAFVTTRLTAFALFLAGAFYVLQPDWLGWSWLAEQIGGETRLVSAGVGFVFFMLAAQALENGRLRLKIAELMETFRQLLYGKDYRNEREMIVVLIAALEADDPERREKAHEHLQRLTGKNFAADPGVWLSWWKANERYFELKDRPPKSRVRTAADRPTDAAGDPDGGDADTGDRDGAGKDVEEPPRP